MLGKDSENIAQYLCNQFCGKHKWFEDDLYNHSLQNSRKWDTFQTRWKQNKLFLNLFVFKFVLNNWKKNNVDFQNYLGKIHNRSNTNIASFWKLDEELLLLQVTEFSLHLLLHFGHWIQR